MPRILGRRSIQQQRDRHRCAQGRAEIRLYPMMRQHLGYPVHRRTAGMSLDPLSKGNRFVRCEKRGVEDALVLFKIWLTLGRFGRRLRAWCRDDDARTRVRYLRLWCAMRLPTTWPFVSSVSHGTYVTEWFCGCILGVQWDQVIDGRNANRIPPFNSATNNFKLRAPVSAMSRCG